MMGISYLGRNEAIYALLAEEMTFPQHLFLCSKLLKEQQRIDQYEVKLRTVRLFLKEVQ